MTYCLVKKETEKFTILDVYSDEYSAQTALVELINNNNQVESKEKDKSIDKSFMYISTSELSKNYDITSNEKGWINLDIDVDNNDHYKLKLFDMDMDCFKFEKFNKIDI